VAIVHQRVLPDRILLVSTVALLFPAVPTKLEGRMLRPHDVVWKFTTFNLM
jgi:hypothetical protein